MDYKKINRSYLYMIIITILYTIGLSVYLLFTGGEMSFLVSNLFSELIVLLPVLIMVLRYHDNLKVLIPLKKIKISSALLTLLYLVMLFPLISFVNTLSMLFVDNTVMEISDSIVSAPMWQMVLSIGIVGPFVEEIVFRGAFLHCYQRTGRIVGSIVLSSVLFGVMHMNFNQFAYATVIGIMFSLLVEATGSVLTSYLAHAVFNTVEVIFLYSNANALSEAAMTLEGEEFSMALNIVMLFFAALICTAIALCVVVKISDEEQRKDFFINIPHSPKGGIHLVTVSLVISLVIAFAWMIFVEVITKMGA